MTAEDNKKLAVEFWNTFCTADAAKAFEMFADDADWTVMGKSTIAKPGAVSKDVFIEQMLTSGGSLHPERREQSVFPDGLQQTIHTVIGEGDHVVLEAESYSVAKNGNTYNNTYSVHFFFRNGKIQTVREYSDTHHAWTAVGDIMHLAATPDQ
ncbi:nuclear transport factor 2 family protein [Nocardia fusca]|uniref:nuclear transport factor 2 family protein n=1 Tax=Nocardia fusca TaxID=941183 RepID=UPI0037B65813